LFSTYDRSGVRLAYPENWKLEEDSDDEARLHLTVTSPNTAYWSLVVYSEVLDLGSVLDQTVAALRSVYPELETIDADERVADVALTGRDVHFFYLDLTSTVRVRALHRGASTYLILCQAEDREMEQVDGVFRAITQSLLADPPPVN